MVSQHVASRLGINPLADETHIISFIGRVANVSSVQLTPFWLLWRQLKMQIGEHGVSRNGWAPKGRAVSEKSQALWQSSLRHDRYMPQLSHGLPGLHPLSAHLVTELWLWQTKASQGAYIQQALSVYPFASMRSTHLNASTWSIAAQSQVPELFSLIAGWLSSQARGSIRSACRTADDWPRASVANMMIRWRWEH